MEDQTRRLHVGVLGIIGSFLEHVNQTEQAYELLKQMPYTPVANVQLKITVIRKAEEVSDDLDGLIIPGGETTVLATFLSSNNFIDVLKAWVNKPEKFTWGTCAGLIALSENIDCNGKDQPVHIGGIDITCLRNAFGRQNQSHVTELDICSDALRNSLGARSDDVSDRFSGVFIRAPAIETIDSPDVQVLCVHPAIKSVEDDNSEITNVEKEQPAGVRQGNKIACSFHPELTDDCRWHAYFLRELIKSKFEKTS